MAGNNKLFVAKNGLRTQNIEYLSPDRSSTITQEMLDSDTLSWEGDSGQLFSITDSLTGTIFSVNDISGIPSIEVDDDGTIRFAEFAGNVLIGTDTDDGTNKLQVSGSVTATSFSGNLDYSDITNPPTIGDGTLTVSGGSGLSGSGTFDANAATNNTITINHSDTSTQSSVNNSGGTVIQDVTLDGFGHVTSLGSKTLSASDVGALGVNDKAADADLLDGLNSSQFLRSDADNSYIDFSNNEQTDYDVDGRLYWDLSAGLYIKSSSANSSSPRLLWSGANVSSGGGIDISYGSEDYPTIAHSDTSSQSSVNNSGDTLIQDISVDAFGHVTNIGSKTLSSFPIVISDSPPSSPSDGALWWDSSDGNLYVYYVDGDSGQWVTAASVTDGKDGEDGVDGANGADGADGEGVALGGTAGQVLAKVSSTDFDTEWIDISSSEANATDDTSSSTLYPIMVGSTGSDQVIKASTSNLELDASSGTLSVTSLTETSSRRYKKNIEGITGALDVVRAMEGVTFDRKDGTSSHESGLIAEDLHEIVPSLVALDDEGNPNSVYYTRIIAYLIESIKEQQKQIDELRKSNHG